MVTANEPELETGSVFIADEGVHDDTEIDDIVESVQYNITSYGADYDIEGLVRRLRRGSMFVPEFQRGYVWSLPQASQFIESLLLGLPVPGIFLALEPETEKLMVIDGQQRLKTLSFFYAGVFREGEADEILNRPFALRGVNQAFEKMKYADLREPDQYRLDNSLLHATIVRQNSPEDGMSSIFHIFHRLNTGGERLTPQEIRRALFRGQLMDSVTELNDNCDWRAIYGRKNPRQKDQELILRFWAMYLNSDDYSAPMLGFLNKFSEKHRNPSIEFLYEGRSLFSATMNAFNTTLGNRAFHTGKSSQLNAAVFDSMSVGLARLIQKRRGDTPDSDALRAAHDDLLKDSGYIAAVSGGTAEALSVDARIRKATEVFGNL